MVSDEKIMNDLTKSHPGMDEGNNCVVCGNYSDDLRNVNGTMICEECEETTTVV